MTHMTEILKGSPQTSPFPFLRTTSEFAMNPGKRARSPDDEERPLKRPSVAVDEFNRHQFSRSSASSSRQPSEDWVRQAGGLSIESPIYTPGDLHNNQFLPRVDDVVEEEFNYKKEEEDVDMAMDSDDIQNTTEDGHNRAKPLVTPLHTSLLQSHLQAMQQGETNMQHRHTYATRYSERLQPTIMPSLNVLPATSIQNASLSHQQYHGPIFTNAGSSAPLSYQVQDVPHDIQLSATESHSSTNPFHNSQPNTKRRVVFGPRANCEKCRLGVPGHFIHYE